MPGLRSLVIVALALAAAAPRARAAEPIDLLPAECLLCWYGRPLPDAPQPSDEQSALQTLIDIGQRVAGQPLDPKAQLGARLFEAIAHMARYDHALALIDAQAKPVAPDGRIKRVDRLQLAMLVRTRGRSELFLRIIQKAVNEQTNGGFATLARRRAQRWDYQELRDTRLPEWSVIAWGELDDHFVITVGQDVWPLIASVAVGEHASLGSDEWLRAARERRGRDALIEIVLAADRFRTRLDPVVDGRATAFFHGWDADNLQRAHWALGYQDRALFCAAHFEIGGKTIDRLYADPAQRDPRWLQAIPPGTRYAIFQYPMERLLPSFVRAINLTNSAESRAANEKVWSRVQAEYGFDAERDIVGQLGDHLVLHNDPPHPLRLPLAFTSLIEIRGDARRLRNALQKLCTAWKDHLDKIADETGIPNLNRIERDGDIWYFQFGPFAGPAWIITDRFVVTSWSPKALRTYLEHAGPAVGNVIPAE